MNIGEILGEQLDDAMALQRILRGTVRNCQILHPIDRRKRPDGSIVEYHRIRAVFQRGPVRKFRRFKGELEAARWLLEMKKTHTEPWPRGQYCQKRPYTEKMREYKKQWRKKNAKYINVVCKQFYWDQIAKAQQDHEFYAQLRAGCRERSRRHRDKTRVRQYREKLTMRLPDWSLYGESVYDLSSPFIWENRTKYQQISNKAYALELRLEAMEKRRKHGAW